MQTRNRGRLPPFEREPRPDTPSNPLSFSVAQAPPSARTKPLRHVTLLPSTLPSVRWRALALALAAMAAAGCSTYSDRTRGAYGAFRSGQFDQAVQRFEDTAVTDSKFLSMAESGMAALVAGDWESARERLTVAAELADDFADEAPVDLENAVESLGSLVLNDAQLDYEGEGFERVYVHVALGLAYLAEGKVDDLLVEMRRADKLLVKEQELYDADYRAGGLAHFLSASAYQLKGELDQALLDYQRMVDKGVGLELAGPELSLLAQQTYRTGEFAAHLEAWEPSPFPAGLEPGEAPAAVVVIGGAGLAPVKAEARLDFATPSGIVSLTAPSYVDNSTGDGGFILHARDSGTEVRTAVLEHVGDVARENLDDRITAIAVRTALRNVARFTLRNELEDEHGAAAALAFDFVGAFLERADLRCWSTLPNTWHGARLRLPAGQHALELSSLTGGFEALGTFDLEPGETLIILARSIDQRMFAHVLGGDRVQLIPTAELLAPEGAAPVTPTLTTEGEL